MVEPWWSAGCVLPALAYFLGFHWAVEARWPQRVTVETLGSAAWPSSVSLVRCIQAVTSVDTLRPT
jgi:hypothetical protein